MCGAGESEGGQSKIKIWSFQTLGLAVEGDEHFYNLGTGLAWLLKVRREATADGVITCRVDGKSSFVFILKK